MEKSKVLAALSAFVRQRPGLEFGNYGDVSAYRAELRVITKTMHQANELIGAVAWRDSISGDAIVLAANYAFSGRLTINPDYSIDYCTGQYWPTEYRSAVCAVLSQVLWDYWREAGLSPRIAAKKELSRAVATRWFY